MIRISDPDSPATIWLVHTVEIGPTFITFWLKGQLPGRAWAAKHGLKDKHNTEVYHVGEGNYAWLPGVFPGKESQGWSQHYHVDLSAPPTLADFTPYLDETPPALHRMILGYFSGS